MKKFILFICLILSVFTLNAKELDFDNFSTYATEQNVRYFAKDISGLLGSSSFTTGRILGWGGFQLAARGVYMPRPNKHNTAFGTDKAGKFMPLIQGEIGLPFRLDGFIRATSWDGLTIAGGGLKWGITKPTEILYTFQPMIVIMAQNGVHRDFTITQYSASFALSFKTPYVVPYIGGGVDYAHFTVETADDSSLVGKREFVTTPKAVAGFNFKLPSYLDLSLAANYTNYGLGAEASLGVRF